MIQAELEPLISEEEIAHAIEKLASKINADYKGEQLTLVMILKGSLCFVADLIRLLHVPCKIEMIRCQSYGHRGDIRGELVIDGIDNLELKGQNLLLLDDIFDSGSTLSAVYQALKQKHPKSLKCAVLLSKKVKRAVSFAPDYTVFEIENQFVVGYGLDYKEYYRGLPGIYVIHLSQKDH